MMIRSVPVSSSSVSSSSSVLCNDLHLSVSSTRFASTICCSSRSNASIPKLEPFSRSKLDRALKDPPLIEKSENDIADYCSTLEGDNSYSCWRAYFELKDLERESPKEDVEKLIIQAGGVKSLIGILHGIAAIHKEKKEKELLGAAQVSTAKAEEKRERPFPVPDGLPKSAEELEEEEKGRMPDSPFTRLLRTIGEFPAWYSPAPDHETD
ncbi:CCG-binding protein 1 [Malania oleifera]|uniref:CCG-binding protein 1 n=1 Tax=Malania oleifera TaxID=397392 RepID=UPI0025AE13F8|nr:CCG-binding protein 1 [Malania oleifera]